MGLLVVTVVTVGAFALLWWFWKASQTPSKRHRRPAPYRRSRRGHYESPLGLVDDPDDEWVEWAIMDDMLDDGGGDGWW